MNDFNNLGRCGEQESNGLESNGLPRAVGFPPFLAVRTADLRSAGLAFGEAGPVLCSVTKGGGWKQLGYPRPRARSRRSRHNDRAAAGLGAAKAGAGTSGRWRRKPVMARDRRPAGAPKDGTVLAVVVEGAPGLASRHGDVWLEFPTMVPIRPPESWRYLHRRRDRVRLASIAALLRRVERTAFACLRRSLRRSQADERAVRSSQPQRLLRRRAD